MPTAHRRPHTVFQSTRPTRGATPAAGRRDLANDVSIHAPHEGRDVVPPMQRQWGNSFNPRAPRGARPGRFGIRVHAVSFQSTRPTRGATLLCRRLAHRAHVSIHAPHEGRDTVYYRVRAEQCVSIHAPHEGRDAIRRQRRPACAQFQSTRPTRGATCPTVAAVAVNVVSIHAPHEGRDHKHNHGSHSKCVSIHAPHEGRDTVQMLLGHESVRFNPRAPRGARRGHHALHRRGNLVSIHAPHEGRDLRLAHQRRGQTVSIHAPHEGRDRATRTITARGCRFNPRAPRGARPQ